MKEKPFTKINNEILESLSYKNFTTLETKALFLILRQTIGWGRCFWKLKSWKPFVDIGLHKTTIRRTLEKMVDKGILIVDFEKKEITFIEDTDIWKGAMKKVSQTANSELANQLTGVSQTANSELANQLTGVSQTANSESCEDNDGAGLQEPKEPLKETIKDIIKESDNNNVSSLKQEADIVKRRILFDLIKKHIPTWMDVTDKIKPQELEVIISYPVDKIREVALYCISKRLDDPTNKQSIISYIYNTIPNFTNQVEDHIIEAPIAETNPASKLKPIYNMEDIPDYHFRKRDLCKVADKKWAYDHLMDLQNCGDTIKIDKFTNLTIEQWEQIFKFLPNRYKGTLDDLWLEFSNIMDREGIHAGI